jgi:L-methionine (R)-S-oxide reductase
LPSQFWSSALPPFKEEPFLIETDTDRRAKQSSGATKSIDSHNEAKRMTPAQRELLQEFESYAQTAPRAQSVMEKMVNRLHEKMTRYNWVGFYLVDPADAGYLIVGPYAGSFTPNARIPLSTGLCGAAAASGQIVVVQDVTKDPRYLAGSSLVKSEMVVPIFVSKKLAGELDVESYFGDTFPKAEQEFVEACAEVVAKYLGKGVVAEN